MPDLPGQGDLFGCDSRLLREFWAFHRANPQVYRLFCRFTREAIEAGRRHFGARMIYERIRWYTMIETRSADGFKLNDHHHPYYARLFMRDHPEYAGFFRTRKAQGEIV
ncbi:MAG: hypothetical protein CMH55_07655 [Myxococcales bacterium]|nr:hypothetical protein [Myxococcales bacterium]